MTNTNLTVCAWVLAVASVSIPLPAASQATEYVAVKEVTDDRTVIVRSSGAEYSIETGIGCISLPRYEGRRVVVSSPGMFRGIGSKLVIPGLDQECRIWDSNLIKDVTSNSPRTSTRRSLGSRTTGTGCYKSSVTSPTPFMGNHDEIFTLSDGTIWQVQHEYEYMYEYYPEVVVCPSTQRMMVGSTTLDVSPVAEARLPSQSQGQPSRTPEVIESRIDGEFEGWDGETIFKLQNGQIWQQSSYAYTYRYAYSPEVLIYKSGPVYKMRVDDVDGEIIVRRLR